MGQTWMVTGGIGSGKSTIRARLAELGAVVIDADEVAREILAPGTDATAAVAERWPAVVSDGAIDRAALAAIVFTDPDSLRELESITHPAIRDEIAGRVDEAGEAVVVVEVSVPSDMVGAGWERTIVADLPVPERVRRLRARGMDPIDIERRMAAQPGRDEWRRLGRWVISTEGSRAEVAERVDALWEHMNPVAE